MLSKRRLTFVNPHLRPLGTHAPRPSDACPPPTCPAHLAPGRPFVYAQNFAASKFWAAICPLQKRPSPLSWAANRIGRRCAMPPPSSTTLKIGHAARIVSAHRTPERLVAFRERRQGGGLQGYHRWSGRRCPPSRHDCRTDCASGIGGSHRNNGAGRPGFTLFDRADAGGRARRHFGDRKARRDQRGASRRRDPRLGRSGDRRAAFRLARRANWGGGRTALAGGLSRAFRTCPWCDDRDSRRRAIGAHARSRSGEARAQDACLHGRPREPGVRRGQHADGRFLRGRAGIGGVCRRGRACYL